MSKHMVAAADNLILKMRCWRKHMRHRAFVFSPAAELIQAIDRWETAYAIELDTPGHPEETPGEGLQVQHSEPKRER